MFSDLTEDEANLLEDMLFSASVKTFDVYGAESEIYIETAHVWWSVLSDVYEKRMAA